MLSAPNPYSELQISSLFSLASEKRGSTARKYRVQVLAINVAEFLPR
jgi:hypothetical protein